MIGACVEGIGGSTWSTNRRAWPPPATRVVTYPQECSGTTTMSTSSGHLVEVNAAPGCGLSGDPVQAPSARTAQMLAMRTLDIPITLTSRADGYRPAGRHT